MPYAASLCVLSLFVCCAVRAAPQVPQHETLIAVTHQQIRSTALGDTRDVFVWLPDADAGAAHRYPVLVMLDAQDQNNFRSLLANVRYLIDRKVIPPIMVIGVPFGASRDHDMSPPIQHGVPPIMQYTHETPGGADVTGRFIVDELLPWAEARYPTLPTRLLVGHSLGALFALYIAAKQPSVFRIVIAASPGLGLGFGSDTDITRRLAADSVHPRSIFVTSGDLEDGLDQAVTQFATTLTSLVPDPAASHLAFHRQHYEAYDHSMTPLPTLIDGLRWAYSPMRVPIDSVLAVLSNGPPKDTGQILMAWHGLESRFHAGAVSLGVPDAVFPESATNLIGYYCTVAKQSALANRVFRENVRRYPKSSNAEESLAEGLLAVNDTAGAIAAFRRTLVLSTRGDDLNAIVSHAFLRQLHQEGSPLGGTS
jgi:uncharacterized protein